VEPDTASSLYKSLKAGKSLSIATSPTILTGLECGTISTAAWPILKEGVDASTSVSDLEVHEAIQYLEKHGINAGPCGAAALAGFRHVARTDPNILGLNEESIVVLICTEGSRPYKTPMSVASEDTILLTQTLVQIDSSNPNLSSSKGAGESEIAAYIAQWLEHRDIEVHWIEPISGRPSVIGIVRGTEGGKSLMLNGHIDTVTNDGYQGDPMSGEIRDGSIYGRGSLDMKSGIAASLIVLSRVKQAGLRGDVILSAVADEENLSLGTEQVLQAGWRADAAILVEPSSHNVVLSHKGFIWLEVDILGVAAHGSRPKDGVDAFCKAGYFHVELDKHVLELMSGPEHPSLGTGTIHAVTIKGGQEPCSYAAKCTVSIERRTVPGETTEIVEAQLKNILDDLQSQIPDFKYELRLGFHQAPFQCSEDEPFVHQALGSIESVLGSRPHILSEAFWTDAALLSEKGIPTLMFGVKGKRLHGKTEFAEIESIRKVTDALTQVALDFCK